MSRHQVWEYTLYTALIIQLRDAHDDWLPLSPPVNPKQNFDFSHYLPFSLYVYLISSSSSHTLVMLAALGVTASSSACASMHSYGAVGIDSRRAYSMAPPTTCRVSQCHSPLTPGTSTQQTFHFSRCATFLM